MAEGIKSASPEDTNEVVLGEQSRLAQDAWEGMRVQMAAAARPGLRPAERQSSSEVLNMMLDRFIDRGYDVAMQVSVPREQQARAK